MSDLMQENTSYDKTLYAKLLPPELIIKGFIKNEVRCNYEKYLLEFVNKSSTFSKKAHNHQYVAPHSESNGEHDCVSQFYCIDFKLLAAKTALQARSILSDGKYLLAEGALATTHPKRRGETVKATIIHAALRAYSYEDLMQLKANKPKKHGVEHDICNVLETLETPKNLLLFYPYEFGFDHQYEFLEGVFQIQNALNNDFQNAMKYRNSVSNNFDTYFAFVYDDFFTLMELKGSELAYVERIPLKESTIYMCLNNYSFW